MKAGYLMERLREVRSTPFDPQTVFDELSRVESMISEEVFGLGPVRLIVDENDNTDLLVGPPYDGLYLRYLCAQLDLMAQEYDSASTEMTVFTGLYGEFAKWYRRKHLPARGAEVHSYV